MAEGSDAQKRKLSLDAAGPDDEPKRQRNDKDHDAASDVLSLAATDGLSENDMDDRDDISDTPTANPAHTIDGPGPYEFYCWADALCTLFNHFEDPPYFTLKSAALEAYSHVADVPKDEQYEALLEHIDAVRKWHVEVEDAARETPAAQLLVEAWNAPRDEEKEEGEEEEDEDAKAGWWYELDAQREKPGKGRAALEIELEGEGKWWITGFRHASRDGRLAMSALVDYLAVDELY